MFFEQRFSRNQILLRPGFSPHGMCWQVIVSPGARLDCEADPALLEFPQLLVPLPRVAAVRPVSNQSVGT